MSIGLRTAAVKACASCVLLAVLLCWAGMVRAFVPAGERVAAAVAKANRASKRVQALQLELTLRVAEREPIGRGLLVTHPNGLARLELRDADNRIERHLLIGTEHSASSNGEVLANARSLLPPLFLLQASTPETLRQALVDYGLDPEAVALAPCGVRVCYVLGDPARVPPPQPEVERNRPALDALVEASLREAGLYQEPEEELEEGIDSDSLGQESEETKAGEDPALQDAQGQEGQDDSENAVILDEFGEPIDELAADDALEGEPLAGETELALPLPTVWLDTLSFEIRRIESSAGVTIELGELVEFGGVRFPDSITITEPNQEPVHLQVEAVTPVNAPAAAFRPEWLLSLPSDPPSGLAAPQP